MEKRPENARSRPCGAASADVSDVPRQVIDKIEDSETLHLRQARRIADWYNLSEPVARVVAELAFLAARGA